MNFCPKLNIFLVFEEKNTKNKNCTRLNLHFLFVFLNGQKFVWSTILKIVELKHNHFKIYNTLLYPVEQWIFSNMTATTCWNIWSKSTKCASFYMWNFLLSISMDGLTHGFFLVLEFIVKNQLLCEAKKLCDKQAHRATISPVRLLSIWMNEKTCTIWNCHNMSCCTSTLYENCLCSIFRFNEWF